jgi:prevent-host-death family protein
MIKVSTNTARAKFSEIVDTSQHEPVEIVRHGRVLSVLLSKRDFEKLKQIEDQWWISHSITPAKSAKKEILEALESDEWVEDILV